MTSIFKKDKTNLVKWKKEESVPKTDIVYAMAEYFGVSTDYLLGRTEKEELIESALSQMEYEMIKELRAADPLTRRFALSTLKAVIETGNKTSAVDEFGKK